MRPASGIGTWGCMRITLGPRRGTESGTGSLLPDTLVAGEDRVWASDGVSCCDVIDGVPELDVEGLGSSSSVSRLRFTDLTFEAAG